MNDINVTSAQYVNELGTSNIDHIFATVDGVEVTVPIDTDNVVYTAIKAKHDDADDSFTIQDAD